MLVQSSKKGGKEDPCNYRPVSLTSVTGENLEQIIKPPVSDHLEKNAILGREKAAFIKNKSCQTNLIFFCKTQKCIGHSVP